MFLFWIQSDYHFDSSGNISSFDLFCLVEYQPTEATVYSSPSLKSMSSWIWSKETCCLRTAHLYESVWFPPAEENEAQVDTLSHYVLENRPWMQCRACSIALSCVLSFPLSVCHVVPFLLTYTCTPPTVRSVYDVWMPFLLNDYTIHWGHLFSECEWITFQYYVTIKGVQVFKQIRFMLSESSFTTVC